MRKVIGAVPNAVDAATGALLGTFVGDALGMSFEGKPAAAIPARPEMKEARLGRGTYTDDTQMMIALAESLLECGEVDEHHLGLAFLDAFDPNRGYGSGTKELFTLWRRGVPVTEAASRLHGGQGSRGNGAAMRIAPIAVRFARLGQLRAQSERSARLTHTHPLAIDAAVVQAAAIAAALRGEDILTAAHAAAATRTMLDQLDRVRELLVDRPDPEETGSKLGNSAEGHRSVPAAIVAAVSQPGFEDAVGFAVQWRRRHRHARGDGRSHRWRPRRCNRDPWSLVRRTRGRRARAPPRRAARECAGRGVAIRPGEPRLRS